MCACPSAVQLDEYVTAGECGDDIRAHLAQCANCRAKVAELRADRDFLRDFVKIASSLDRRNDPPDLPDHRTSRVPGYTVRRVCGRGGQAVVYEAIQLSTRRRVALKVLEVGRRGRERRLRRFEREIELVAGLRHPHIVTVYDSGFTSEGQPFFAMEYVEGIPINEYCQNLGSAQLAPERRVHAVLRLFADVCDAVRHAQQQGIIHRDLKPSNVLVDDAGTPRVLDFGLARVTCNDPEYATLTKTGEFLGTLIYAAPEQLSAGSAAPDTRTDVYALGVMLYELLTGTHPYPVDGSAAEVIRAIQHCQPRSPSHVSAINDELSTIMLKALAKDPERRYESAAALLDDVSRYLAGQPISAKRDSLWYLLRTTARCHRGAVATAFAFALLLVVFSITMGMLYRDTQVAERTARRTAHKLAATLSLSNVERGRLTNLSGNAALAEDILWREYLAHPPNPPHRQPDGHWYLPTNPSYWALWEVYRRNPCRATVRTHAGHILALTFQPNRSVILVLSSRGSLLRWDPDHERLETVRRLPVAGSHLRGCFSPDGQFVAWSDGYRVVVQRTDDGRTVLEQPLDPAAPPNTHPVISDDGQAVALAIKNAIILVADTSAPDWHRIDVGDSTVHTLCFDHSGQTLWAMLRDAGGWHLRALAVRGRSQGPSVAIPSARATTMCVGSGGRLLFFAANRNVGRLQLEDLCLLSPWRGHLDLINTLAASTDGRWIASGSGDKTIRLWRCSRSPQSSRVLLGHQRSVVSVAFSRDGRRVVSGDAGGTLKLWDTGDVARRVVPCAGTVHGLSVAIDGGRVALCGSTESPSKGWFQIRDLHTWHVLCQSPEQAMLYPSIAFLPDGRNWVTCNVAGSVSVWSPEGLARRRTGLPSLSHIAVSPNGRLLATTCNRSPGDILIFDTSSLEPLTTLHGHSGRTPSVAFNPDGSTLASASRDGTVILWDTRTFTRRATLTAHHASVRVARFSPDGAILATGGDDWTVRLWDGHTGRALRALTGHRQHVFAVAFSPDGRLLASGDRGATIRLWNVATGRNLLTIDEQSGGHVMDLVFGPTGRQLLVATTSGLLVWDLAAYTPHLAGNRSYQTTKRASDALPAPPSSALPEPGAMPERQRGHAGRGSRRQQP